MAVEITKTAKSVKRYGYLFPVGATDMSIELACYSLRANYPTEHSTEFHFRNAWKIMWPNFQWNQWAEMMVWAWCNYENIAVIGHSASGKSFLAAHCLLLDFIARPLETSTTVTTTKFDALRTRIWGDVMQAIETSAIKSLLLHLFKITTTSNELKVSIKDAGPEYINKRLDKDKFIIQGVATDGADVNASKLRGQHTNRRRIVADECEDMGAALYGAMTNARTAPDWKALLLTNPAERTGEFGGKWACPKEGWGSVTENDLSWETVQPNGICLHFDGLQSPNIKAGSTIYPYLLTQKYIDEIRSVNGEDSLHWWMFVRGMPAPDGVVAKIWPSSTIAKVKQAAEFDFPPVPCASLDPAFGGDDCILLLAERGRLRTGQPYITVKQRIKIKVIEGPDRLLKEQQICDETIRACREWRVTPDNLIIDGPQPLDEPVLTPNGWRCIGNLKIGDSVIGSSGKPVKVTGIYPQGTKPVVRMDFNDGAWTRCTLGHLWATKCRVKGERILTTKQIADELARGGQKMLSVPKFSSPVEYATQAKGLIDPYLLGALLGDGSFRGHSVRFCTTEKEMIDRIIALLPIGMKAHYDGSNTYSLTAGKPSQDKKTGRLMPGSSPLLNAIRNLGLEGIRGENKFIPEQYMRASPEDRLALIQGLMDTDGYACTCSYDPKTSTTGYRSTSHKLVQQLIELVESLGGSGTIRQDKQYRERKQLPTWSAFLSLPDGVAPFRRTRKLAQFRKRRSPKRRIIRSITECGEAECVCIKVDAEDHLYATRHGILTHNTGQGQGVLALLRTHFGQKVEALYYGGEATDRPLRMDDPKKASDQVKYFVTELWFRASYMANSGMMGGLHNLSSRAEEDLAARRYLVKDARMIAESKTELKKRIGHSPDEADAFCQLGELMIRRGMLGEYVIGGKRTSLPANGRMLARKAARRYAQEFTHVAP